MSFGDVLIRTAVLVEIIIAGIGFAFHIQKVITISTNGYYFKLLLSHIYNIILYWYGKGYL